MSYEFAERRVGDSSILVADNSLAKKVLEWTPQYSDLENVIKTALQWYQKENNIS